MSELTQKLGLTEKQSKIYLAVLELGSCTMTELAHDSKLKRPTCYLLVEELLMMGLLTQLSKGKRKIYSAVHPRRLLEIAKTREREIEDILPQLVSLHNSKESKPKIRFYEYGYVEAVNYLYDEIYSQLNNKDELLCFTNIESLPDFPKLVKMYKKLLRSVKDPKIRELCLGNKVGIFWAKQVRPYQGKNHFVRILPMDFVFGGTDTLIFGNKVVLFSLKKDPFVVVIESEPISTTLRAMYEWAWRMGKEVSKKSP